MGWSPASCLLVLYPAPWHRKFAAHQILLTARLVLSLVRLAIFGGSGGPVERVAEFMKKNCGGGLINFVFGIVINPVTFTPTLRSVINYLNVLGVVDGG